MAKYLNVELMFKDRIHAGNLLAEKLETYELKNPLVVALPRGGVEVARPISEKLKARLTVIVSKKIGAPNNPEFALGAVTSHGDYVIAPYSDFELGEKKWDYLQKQIVYLVNDCREREQKFLSIGRDAPLGRLYTGQNVILVDDGIATGMTAQAAIKSIKKQNPSSIIVATPVISTQAYDEIEPTVNKIETLKIPRDFVAVGLHYEDFQAVSDDQIKAMLVS